MDGARSTSIKLILVLSSVVVEVDMRDKAVEVEEDDEGACMVLRLFRLRFLGGLTDTPRDEVTVPR